MIRRFRHEGLRRFYHDDEARGLAVEHVSKLRDIFALPDAAGALSDLDLAGLRLHALKGEFKDFHRVTARANWRVIFRFEGGDTHDVEFLDYH